LPMQHSIQQPSLDVATFAKETHKNQL